MNIQNHIRLLVLLSLISIHPLRAQEKRPVKFQIADDKILPIGANIFLADTNIPYGTVTDINGQASLNVPYNNRKIRVSFLGSPVLFEIPKDIDSLYLNIGNRYFQKASLKAIISK